MKKVVLCAAALVFGSLAYAQVAGAPTASTPVPVLSTAAGANAGQSVQNGDDNKVRIRQAGSNQTVYTEQDNGSLGGGNLAILTQVGDVSSVSGHENAAELRQSGEANESLTYQGGDENNAVTLQGQNDGDSERNQARIAQGVLQSEGNYAAIEQDGDDNIASTRQTYDNSDAWTTQIGNENKSMVVQNAAPDGSDGHEARNYQEGDRNESSINQSGAGARNIATASQKGDDNASKQLQTTHAGTGMTGNRGDVTQGIPATFDPLITTLFADIVAADPDALPVIGSQLASVGAVAFQTQNGKENEAAIRQFGGSVGNSNYAEQEQYSGWGNDAAIEQGHFGSAGDNYGKQFQAGDNNVAGLVQSGSGHKALQDQRGHRNDALSSQRGTSNLLNIHQRGNDNAAMSGQDGIANAALIVQYSGQSFVASQNLDSHSGGGNQIDALQVGPNGNFGSDYAIDCGFEDQKDPWMDYSVPPVEIDDICPDC